MAKTNKIKIVLLTLICMVCICFGFVINDTKTTYAATTPYYTMQVNYTIKRTSGLGTSGTSTTTGTGYSVSVQTGQYAYTTATVCLYGTSYSGTENFPIGSYINSNTITITSTIGTITVTNSSGTQVGSASKSLTLSGLSDGQYNVSLAFGSCAWATSARSGVGINTTGTTSFIVDTSGPTLYNVSTSTTGKYVNSDTYVYASDSGSGVNALYIKLPTNGYYGSVTNGTTITSSWTSGLYSFYAIDNAGNKSSTYYLNLDTVAPTGYIYNSNGSSVSAYINSSFYYMAWDTFGVSYAQYKTPSSSSWLTYTLGTVIDSTSSNGYYYFRTIDKAGNISAEKSILLDTAKPTLTIKNESGTAISKYTKDSFYCETSDSGSGVKTIVYKAPSSSSWQTYSSGTVISNTSENGSYQFMATDNAGNVSDVVSILLDTKAPILTFQNCNGIRITSDCINYAFYCISEDETSGLSKLEYIDVSNSTWTDYSKGRIITTTNGDGVYKFRATDNAGNVSEVYSITLDTEKPTLVFYSNSGTVSNRGRTKGDYIYCYSTDNLSETVNTFVEKPNSTSFVKYIEGSQLAQEGTYYFYALDKAGNMSENCSITLDKSAPSIGCLETNFYSTYGLGFTVTATDSGDVKLYYKTPSSSNFIVSTTNSYVTDFNSENGKHYFYAIDDLGNRTQTYWIDLQIVYPDPTIENSIIDNSVKITWTNGNIATLNGYKYDEGTWITEEGDYTVIVTNEYGLQTTKQFSIVHNYVVIKVVEPTCTEGGYTIFRCSSCGDEYVGNVKNAIGHNYKEEVIEATCTTYGCVRYTCQNCDDIYETDKVNALGHIYTELTRDATCTLDGGQVHLCTVCGYEYLTDVIKATGHDYETEVARVPTCEGIGERHFHCEKCEYEYYVDIPCTGHNFELLKTETVDGETIRTYICTNCGVIQIQNMDEQYDKVSSYVENLFDEYSPYIVWVFISTSGVWSIVMGVFFAIAQKNEEKEKARKMIKNYIIGIVIIFCIVVACPYLVKGIASFLT